MNLSTITSSFSSLSPATVMFMIAFCILFLWAGLVTIALLRLYAWHKRLFGDTRKEQIKEILQEHIERVGVVQIKLNDLETMVRVIQKDGMRHIQKVGIVRFNPFGDTGGDQSFVVAILDNHDNGFVISSLHGRERTRMYAKPVVSGKPEEYPFSDEEKQAIYEAQKRKSYKKSPDKD